MELKFSAKLVCGDKSYPLEPRQKVMLDPVVEHLIALRGCSLDLNEVKNRTIEELRELKDISKSRGTTEELKEQLKEFIKCKGLKMKKIKNDEKVDGKKHERQKEKVTKNEKKGGRKREQKEKKTKNKSTGIIKRRHLHGVSAFSIPNFPMNYPFQDCFQEKLRNRPETEHKVMFQGVLQEKAVAKLMEHFILGVLIQSGFSVPAPSPESNNSEEVALLIDVAHRFLKTFLFVLRRNIHAEVFTKRESEADDDDEKDLWGPLETTLRDIGFGGIIELHRFYYEKIVKKHDRLLKEVACNAHHVRRLTELTSKLKFKTLPHP